MKKIISILTGALISVTCAAFAACDNTASDYGWMNIGNGSQKVENTGENYGIAPILEVDYGAYSLNNIPNAVKGKAYKLFPATANDIYGNEVSVQMNAYINYYTETRSSVSITDGKFLPNDFGVYTVEYTAADSFGNTAKVVYDVQCLEKTPLSVQVQDGVASATVGDVVTVSDILAENAIGELSVQISAISQKGYVEYKIGEDMSFVPEFADTYKIEYTYSDYNEKGTVSYTIDVAENPEPVFKQEISLNDYYIVGCEYQLPQADCFYSKNGKKYDVIPTIDVIYQSGKTVRLSGAAFTPEEAGTLEIVYTANFSSGKKLKTYTATAVDVGYTGEMDMQAYLYGADIQTQAHDYGISIKTVKNTSFDFINPISSREVTVKFGIDNVANLFNRFDIYLTDSADKDNTVKFSFVRSGSKGIFYVNDDEYSALTQGYLALEPTELVYDNATRSATLGDSIALDVSKNIKGEKFEGFKGNTVELSFAFEEVNGYAGIYLYQIDNQVLSSVPGDGFRPAITFERYMNGIHYVGDVVEIDRIWVCDVLDPDYTVEYSVKGPDGQYAKDMNGNSLNTATDYTKAQRFKVTMIGNYIVNIVVRDSCENEQKFSYAIIVTDGEAPVLRFASGATECALGESITIRKAMGYDNITEQLDIYIYVCTPLLNMVEVKMGTSYKPDQKGTYVVYAYAQDEHGNVGMTSYTFEVK